MGDGVDWGFSSSVGWEFDKVVREDSLELFLCLMNFFYELIVFVCCKLMNSCLIRDLAVNHWFVI